MLWKWPEITNVQNVNRQCQCIADNDKTDQDMCVAVKQQIMTPLLNVAAFLEYTVFFRVSHK
jgi:hypothetical protein